MTITRNVAGMELKIELTEEEIKQIVTECAVITVKPLTAVLAAPVTEPASKPESETPAKQYTMPKVIRTGCFKDHKEEVIEMARQGYSNPKIAEYFGVSLKTVQKYCHQWGVNLVGVHSQKGLTIVDGMTMLDEFEHGISRHEIAIRHGVTENTVYYWLNRARAVRAAA